MSKNENGLRYDSGKVEFDLIPPEAMFSLASVLTKGAMKYEKRNWEKGMDWSKCFNSLQRHLWAWLAKDNGGYDEESGLNHMAHALCNCVFLLTYEEREKGLDDRPKDIKKLKKLVKDFEKNLKGLYIDASPPESICSDFGLKLLEENINKSQKKSKKKVKK